MRPSCLFSFLHDSRSSSCDSESYRFLRLWVSLNFFLLERVLKLLGLWVKARRIPGPPCPSFYGHSKLISRGNLTDILAVGLHMKYGSIVKLWLDPTQLLISVKDPTLIKEMLSKAEDKLPLTGRVFQLTFGQLSLFVTSYDKQVQMRRESLTMELDRALFERENVVPAKFVECIMGRMQEGSINCNLVSQNKAFTIMGAALFGDAFLGWSKATVYEELFTMISKDACFWASSYFALLETRILELPLFVQKVEVCNSRDCSSEQNKLQAILPYGSGTPS